MFKHRWKVRVVVLMMAAAWALAPLLSHAGNPSDFGRDIAGVYVVSRPSDEGPSRLLTISADGVLSSIQSIQFSGGASGAGFSNQQGVWRSTGNETVEARVLDIDYDVATGAFAGMGVAIYQLTFLEGNQLVHGTATGKVYPVGVDPLNPGNTVPIAEFNDTFDAKRVSVP